jgi:hypothetical protein
MNRRIAPPLTASVADQRSVAFGQRLGRPGDDLLCAREKMRRGARMDREHGALALDTD